MGELSDEGERDRAQKKLSKEGKKAIDKPGTV